MVDSVPTETSGEDAEGAANGPASPPVAASRIVPDRVIWLVIAAVVSLALGVVALAVVVVILAGDNTPASRTAAPVSADAAPDPVVPEPPPEEPEATAGGAPGEPVIAGSADTETETGSKPASALHVIVYTDEGFSPNRVTVAEGDSVLFVNASSRDFWPASNIHPTHAILPDFDALGPVPPGETWRHTFDAAGEWRYHDHLDPGHGGLVSASAAAATEPSHDETEPTVEDDSVLTLDSAGREFAVLPEEEFHRHFGIYTDDALLDGFLDTYGPNAALDVIQYFDAGADRCHDRAHEVGRASYEKFGAAAFALTSHQCRSGGSHGALETMFAQRGTARLEEDVRAVCSASENPFTRHQCLHGIGHGIMAWTNYELHESLDLCARLGDSQVAQGSCYGGVFMENVVGGFAAVMGHTTLYLRDDDPVYPCNVVKPQYQPDCYLFQTSRMLSVLDGDFAAVADLCDDAPARSKINCWGSYGRDASSYSGLDAARSIALCNHASPGETHDACINGAVQDGFWEPHGADRSVAFCGLLADDPAATASSVDTCYQTIIDRARDLFPVAADYSRFCDALPEARRPRCA